MAKNRVPPAVIREYNNLRSDSSFVQKGEEGLLLFLAMWTKHYRGQRITQKEIGQVLGISKNAVAKTKANVRENLNVEWKDYDLKEFNPHVNELKTILDSIPGELANNKPAEYEGVPQPDGSIDVREKSSNKVDHEWGNMTGIQFLASKHKDIMLDVYKQIDEITTGSFQVVAMDGSVRQVDKVDDTRWMSIYDKLVNTARSYTKDWLELFGHMSDSAVSEAILERKQIARLTIEFLQKEGLAEYVPKYIQFLSEQGD